MEKEIIHCHIWERQPQLADVVSKCLLRIDPKDKHTQNKHHI
jgi:hypothetical protein